jgi:ankyrin repeat protein
MCMTYYSTLHLLIMKADRKTALLLASSGGHASVVALLLDAKADVDLSDVVSAIFVDNGNIVIMM